MKVVHVLLYFWAILVWAILECMHNLSTALLFWIVRFFRHARFACHAPVDLLDPLIAVCTYIMVRKYYIVNSIIKFLEDHLKLTFSFFISGTQAQHTFAIKVDKHNTVHYLHWEYCVQLNMAFKY